MSRREATVKRKTAETDIELVLVVDGSGKADLDTGMPFLEHMLTLFARHGLFDLRVKARGDLEVDGHHTVEDLGLCLGEALQQALGDKAGIKRYGSALLPMDDALVLTAVDLSGRPYLGLDFPLRAGRIGAFDLELVEEFLRAMSNRGAFNLHVRRLAGENNHHLVEALFKGLARALAEACSLDPRGEGIPSTKGVL
jgi:imidazoleglycerol-phosphate dehydratase